MARGTRNRSARPIRRAGSNADDRARRRLAVERLRAILHDPGRRRFGAEKARRVDAQSSDDELEKQQQRGEQARGRTRAGGRRRSDGMVRAGRSQHEPLAGHESERRLLRDFGNRPRPAPQGAFDTAPWAAEAFSAPCHHEATAPLLAGEGGGRGHHIASRRPHHGMGR
jgi:hypothetical protein